jgi:DNA-binding NarL/FixJ family response regulator
MEAGLHYQLEICRVLIVDERAIVRSGIKTMLESKSDTIVFRVAGAASNLEALQKLEKGDYHVVILDDRIQEGSGPTVAKNILKLKPDIRILGMSDDPGLWNVHLLMKAGALGYIRNTISPQDLYMSVVTTFKGRHYYCSQVANSLLEESRVNYAKRAGFQGKITTRELQVLKLIAMGKTTADMASDMSVGKRTVETHRKKLMKKIGVRNVAELVKVGFEHRLLP